MSWSLSFVGKPENIKRKLNEMSASLTGQSKAEFDEAKPALDTLLDLNVAQAGFVQLDANGHANFTPEGVKTYGNCGANLRGFPFNFVGDPEPAPAPAPAPPPETAQ